ncbi:MAG TPA: anti-sigma factor [Anaerolineales bacterium]|nr:anti-sigma factor [Anaerolineales bacterium]
MFERSDQAHVQELLPAYAIGSLEPDEVRRVEEHLLSCLLCRDESGAFREVADQLSLAVLPADPPTDLKARLMNRVQAAQPKRDMPSHAPKRPLFERLLPAWGLASLLLIVALAGLSFSLWQRMDRLEFSTSPGGMRAVPLSPPDAASAATGFVLISADGENGALVVDGLPPLGEDQEYQLWLIRNGERTSGAVFSTDENHYGGTRIRAPLSLLEYSAVGITVEPAGGSPHPTGQQVLAGPLMNP